MSKVYDYDKAKRTIQLKSDVIDSAALGMAEDWFWTAQTVYEDNKFTINLDESPEIAGIRRSHWATPVLKLEYKTGKEEFIDCFTGDSSGVKPAHMEYGCLSGPCNEYIESIRKPKLVNDS